MATQLQSVNFAKATQNFVRTSPFKLRRVADVIRGKNVQTATYILKSLPQKGARILEKILRSAIANAEHNSKMNPNELFISQLLINEAPQMKRFQPRARGRIYKIIKRSSHISLSLGIAVRKQKGEA